MTRFFCNASKPGLMSLAGIFPNTDITLPDSYSRPKRCAIKCCSTSLRLSKITAVSSRAAVASLLTDLSSSTGASACSVFASSLGAFSSRVLGRQRTCFFILSIHSATTSSPCSIVIFLLYASSEMLENFPPYKSNKFCW